MFGTVGWYSNHQNKYFAGFGVLGVIFGDFLKISTIFFLRIFFSSSKTLKKENKQIQTKKNRKNQKISQIKIPELSKNAKSGVFFFENK